MLRERLAIFLALVTIAKLGRYIVVAWLANGWVEDDPGRRVQERRDPGRVLCSTGGSSIRLTPAARAGSVLSVESRTRDRANLHT